jgi:hypothetical protein
MVNRLGPNALNRRFASLGMPDTHLIYDAETSPRDMLNLFLPLPDGELGLAGGKRPAAPPAGGIADQ